MNWNFGFFDADTVRRAAIAAGLGTGASALFPEDAEGAIRSDIFDVVSKAIKGKSYKGQEAGTLESPMAQQAFGESSKYKGNSGYFTEHGLTWRHEQDNWTAEQIAEGYKGIYDSPDTVVVPNVLGRNPTAQEALWNPNGPNGHSWYMPIVPYKKGFKGVTLYDPETSRVEKELKERGYWGGGSTSSIFTPSLGEGLVQPVGSGTLSAVNSGSFNNSLQEQLEKLKLPAVGLGSGLGAGLTLSPEEAFGWGQGGLRTSELKPEDSAPLRTGELRPSDIGGNITADLRLSGTPSSEGTASPFWSEMARQFGLGTRGVLEGLIRRPAPNGTGSNFPPWAEAPLLGRRRISRRKITRCLARERRDALGRRAREAMPDSRSASERGARATGPKSPREQGRRHLVVI